MTVQLGLTDCISSYVPIEAPSHNIPDDDIFLKQLKNAVAREYLIIVPRTY